MGKIEQQISAALNEALNEVVEELTFQIEKAYDQSVDKFYKHNPNGKGKFPKYYDRTETTYQASDRYESIYGPGIEYIGDSPVAGITLREPPVIHTRSDDDEPYFNHNQYSSGFDYVFPRTFEKGIHGIDTLKKLDPSPKGRMDKAFKEIRSKKHVQPLLDKYITDALNKHIK